MADEKTRKKLLSFVFVGGGYAGIEAMAEPYGPLRHPHYPSLSPEDMRWVLFEAMDRIMPEVSAPMGSTPASAWKNKASR